MSPLPTMWLTIDLSHQGQAVGHLAKRKTQKCHKKAIEAKKNQPQQQGQAVGHLTKRKTQKSHIDGTKKHLHPRDLPR